VHFHHLVLVSLNSGIVHHLSRMYKDHSHLQSDFCAAVWQDPSDGFFLPLDPHLLEVGMLPSHLHLSDSSEDHYPHSQALFVIVAIVYSPYISEQFQHLIIVCQDQVNVEEQIV